MIIDAKQYSGKCACGKEHAMSTEFCIIEDGCLSMFDELTSRYGITGIGTAIYDENTYLATEGKHPATAYEIILPEADLHADDHGVALAEERLPESCDYLVAVGAGTVHDITRHIAYSRGIPFVSCPTAASVDGFCSSVAAMTWRGFKKTFTAVSPKIVIADLDVISKAPIRLMRSGVGDMIGKYIALADWRISNIVTGEALCDRIYALAESATNDIISSVVGGTVDISTYEKLTYGLLMSGLAMQMLETSRCASGAEHHISHFIEMKPAALPDGSDALHGEKVGVGTLIALTEYKRLAESATEFRDYPRIPEDEITRIFGTALAPSVIAENSNDSAASVTEDTLAESFDKIRAVIRRLPSPESLGAIYKSLGMKSTLSDIGISEDARELLLDASPIVRNRVTLMRLRHAIAK